MGIRLSSTICESLTLPPSWLPGMDSLSLTLRPVPERHRETKGCHSLVRHTFVLSEASNFFSHWMMDRHQILHNVVTMKDFYTGGLGVGLLRSILSLLRVLCINKEATDFLMLFFIPIIYFMPYFYLFLYSSSKHCIPFFIFH